MEAHQRKLVLVGSTLGVAALAIATVVFFLFRSDSTIETELKLNKAPIEGQVEVLSGTSALHVTTLVGQTELADDGSYVVDGLDGGRELALVLNEEGTPVYYGLITPGEENTLGPESTATVLLFFSSGGLFTPPDAWPTLLDEIESFVADDTLPDELRALAQESADYLVAEDGSLTSFVDAAVDRLIGQSSVSSLFSIPAAQAREFAIDSTPKSGLRVDRGALSNEILITNEYRRMARAMIYEVGYRKDGEDIFYDSNTFVTGNDGHMEQSLTPEKIVDIPTITKVSDLQGTLVDLLYGKTAYGEVSTDPISLEPDHADADATYYHVMVLGWGGHWVTAVDLYGRGGYDGGGLTVEEQAALSEMTMTTFVQEVMLPVFLMGLSSNRANDLIGGSGSAVTQDIVKWLLNDPRADGEGAQAIVQALEQGKLKEAVKGAGEFILKSATLREVIAESLYRRIHGKLGNIGQEFLEEFAGSASRVLAGVDAGLKLFDSSVLATNFALANQASDFIIAVAPPVLSLEPAAVEIDLLPKAEIFRVIVQNATESMQFEYEWSHENEELGYFVGFATDPHTYTSEQDVGVYRIDEGEPGEQDTISVKVSLIERDGARKVLGTATATVTVKEDETACGTGTIELPPAHKLVYLHLDDADKPIFFSAAGPVIHEYDEIIPPTSTDSDFSLVTGASYSDNVEFYRDVVDHGTAYDLDTDNSSCGEDDSWDCVTAVPVNVSRFFVTLPSDFDVDSLPFDQGNGDLQTGGAFTPVYENFGDGTTSIFYRCRIGRWDGSVQY